jgi:imidazoleglycerol phosphate synthase glutamine amidotransferase subunit HisH
VVATCAHGAEFIAVLEKQNICAVQFHPEKSGKAGARLLHNFLRLAA